MAMSKAESAEALPPKGPYAQEGPRSHLDSATTSDQSGPAPAGDNDNDSDNDHGETVTQQYVTGWPLACIVASVALACFLMLVDTMVVSTAVPRITDEFQSLPDIGWYASAYQFGSAAPQPLTGKVYTHFNNKFSFLFFFGIFEVGSVLCGAAVDSNMLIIGRAVAGLGAAGIINGALTIVSSCAPLEKRPALIGLTMGLNQLGLVAGPLIGGAFTTYSTWRWCFYLNLPVGAAVVGALLILRIPEQRTKRRAMEMLPQLYKLLDLGGFCLFAPAVLQLLLALQFGGTRFAWDSAQVIGLFCGSVATFGVWLVWNRHKADDALLPYSMISLTPVFTSGLYQALLMSTLYGATFYLPVYFQAIHSVSPMMSGVYLLPTIIPQLIMAGSSGVIISKIGYVIPPAIFSTVLLSIACGLYALLDTDTGIGKWVGFQILAGVGSGAGLQVAIVVVQAAVSGELLSSAMAFVILCQSLGPAISLALCQLLFYESLKVQIPKAAPGADIPAIIAAGATNFREILEPGQLPGVLEGYSESISQVFYLVASTAAACSLVIWGMGWTNLHRLNAPTPQLDEAGTESTAKAEEKGSMQ